MATGPAAERATRPELPVRRVLERRGARTGWNDKAILRARRERLRGASEASPAEAAVVPVSVVPVSVVPASVVPVS